MKEKVILPEGAEHQRVEVAEAVSKAEQKAKRKPIPKPEPLIGGTPVYQKDNGTGYWYCKIKDGRDEFMYLYFGDLTENDVLYDANGKEREFIGARLEFKENYLKAVRNKPKEGFRWIPVYEPSRATDGGIQYVAGEKVLTGFNSHEWEEIFKNYSPENGSQETSITTCFLLEVRWLKDDLATIDQLVDKFSGNPNPWDRFKKTGECEFGGLYDFGNTFKEAKDPESPTGFSVFHGGSSGFAIRHFPGGGYYFYAGFPAGWYHNLASYAPTACNTGLIELKGATSPAKNYKRGSL